MEQVEPRIAMKIDEMTRAIFLDMPREQIVLLQGMFELYEGVGSVRTVDSKIGLVCILTTESMLDECWQVMDGIRELIHWRCIEHHADPLGRDRV